MMGIKNTDERNALKTINLDNLVPENHIIRKIDKAKELIFLTKFLNKFLLKLLNVISLMKKTYLLMEKED